MKALRRVHGSEGLPVEHRIVIGARTDAGCGYAVDEYSYCVVRPTGGTLEPLLAVVCDGSGGHAAGVTASRLATEVLVAQARRAASDPGKSLVDAVRAANRAIHDAARRDPDLVGMGTACTALAIESGLAWCAHTGDSRCYLVRNDSMLQMTEDHSGHGDVGVLAWPQPFLLSPRDRLLLCTRRFHDVVPDYAILEVIRSGSPQDGCDRLIELARERGASGNVTVVVLAVPP